MFGNRLTLFTLKGFAVRVDASWLLLALLVVWSLAVGYFPFVAPGYEGATYLWMGLAGLAGLAVSIVLHEFAHSVVARRYDIPISGITLFVFGGVAEMRDEPSSPKGEFLMAIAGPVASVAISAAFYLLAVAGAQAGLAPFSPPMVVAAYLSMINLLLAIFNMIPAFPLDGGRVLRSILWAWRKDILWATRMAAGAGGAFGIVLIGLGVWNVLSGNPVGGLWWVLIGFFVRMAAGQSYRQQMARQMLSGLPVVRMMRPDPVTVPPDLPLDRLVDEYFYRHYFKNFPVVSAGHLIGCASLDKVKTVPRAEWPMRVVGDIMEGCSGLTIAAGADANEALARMQSSGRSRLMVARGSELLGVLSLKDLMQYLSFRSELEAANDREGMRKAS